MYEIQEATLSKGDKYFQLCLVLIQVKRFSYPVVFSLISRGYEIYLLQKRAIRNIEKTPYRAHTEPIFKSLNLIKVEDMYYFKKGCTIIHY